MHNTKVIKAVKEYRRFAILFVGAAEPLLKENTFNPSYNL
jgi:hypothetical protein